MKTLDKFEEAREVLSHLLLIGGWVFILANLLLILKYGGVLIYEAWEWLLVCEIVIAILVISLGFERLVKARQRSGSRGR